MPQSEIVERCFARSADVLRKLYGPGYAFQKGRFEQLLSYFSETFGGAPASLFSAPGRTEIGGNHTDHQHGCVVAASVDLDIIAAVRPNDEGVIRVQSLGFARDTVELSALTPQPREAEHSAAILRGVGARFKELGYAIGGFDACTTSAVPKGSGLSSSAAFEVLAGTILSHLYNGGRVDPVEIAKIGQYAENRYFGKPCGLMDQTACSVGGAVFIDFKDPAAPVVQKLDFDFSASGHALCILDSGADHADLTQDYAAMPAEMKAVARCLGAEVLRDTAECDFFAALPAIRRQTGDRAALRAYHFYEDNARACALAGALRHGDFPAFLQLVSASGRSSWQYLQNVTPVGGVEHQDVAFALMLCDAFLAGRGACRVHGGGLAGTVQAFVPLDLVDSFKARVEAVLGRGRCFALNIRPLGGVRICEVENDG